MSLLYGKQLVTPLSISGSLSVTGSIAVTEGGITGSLLGTASYYNETDPIFTAKSASLATTGSNTFRGNQDISGSVTITGSLTVSSSATFTNIGPSILSGSLNIYIPAGAAYGINENPTPNNIFYSYTPQDTNTAAVQVGWTAQVNGGGTYTVTDVQPDTPFAPFISITLNDLSLTLGYRVGVNFSSPAKLWKFDTNGTTNIPGDVNFSGSITLDGGSQITPTLFGYNGNSIDIVAGPGGYAELTSNNTQSYVWVDNNGAYIGTDWDAHARQWEFRDDGYFVLPQVQSLTKQAGILSAGDIIIQADETQSWRFISGSGVLQAPGGIEAPSFTGSLQGTSVIIGNDLTVTGSTTVKSTLTAEYAVRFPSLGNNPQGNVVGIDGSGYLYINQMPTTTAATINQINVPDGANVYVRPDELDQSKYSTHNIFNFLNFT